VAERIDQATHLRAADCPGGLREKADLLSVGIDIRYAPETDT